ncbi:hypothetical protein D3Z35_15605 [Enterococcus faecalis]|uniref:hypothetical protein n=1 Tax=Enterococcus faecalis TaxID=1351 RepID=UPI0013635DC8|nr:hypothetical protein [Enterococcus faecalis]MCO8259919.1 hypothetical protein [Enterococcus faecalis]MCP8907949.1 hypothetical protein [Enterococcus faecalis]MCP8910998.1 hypothetical protein [Enterococcus faecalis]MCP8914043.1 hypothetical protein [Enterococcus faecalis]MCP8936871.1 hypothetical protein [Enterococcus faecalis]
MKFYWEIAPEDFLENRKFYQKFSDYEKDKISKCVYNLIYMYRKYAEKGKELQQTINFKNFKNNIEQLLEIEAILSEIQFYLEEVDLSYVDANNVITLIENEYLVDYYYKIGNADKEGAFFTSLLRNKVYNQQKLRFGISSEK